MKTEADERRTNMGKKEYIVIKGAREHNLKNIDVKIPEFPERTRVQIFSPGQNKFRG